uniref:Uncharacterized protein n=1 Tax=Arundo donax TaxID=35708 RepID=A0A0A8ZWM6_ARUDO
MSGRNSERCRSRQNPTAPAATPAANPLKIAPQITPTTQIERTEKFPNLLPGNINHQQKHNTK